MFTDASFQACCRYGKQRTTQQAFTPCKRRVTERERAKEIRQVSGVACVCAPPSSLSGLDWIPREAGVLLYIINAGGVPTRRAHTHTHKWDGLHTRHLRFTREYTQTHTHTHTQRGPTKHTASFLPHRTLSGRAVCVCLCVCVCVCLCVYSRVDASYAGRPICVCAVSAPLRRVNA